MLRPAEPFPDRVIVLASSRAEMSVLAPWIEAAQRAGYHELLIGSSRAVVVHTRTLGVIHRTSGCVVTVPIQAGTAPWASHTTWGDFAQAAAVMDFCDGEGGPCLIDDPRVE